MTLISKKQAGIVIEYWLRTILCKAFSMKDIINITLKFYNQVKILKFSKQYGGGDIKFMDEDKCVIHKDCSHTYVLADIEPVKSGIHCWRVQVIVH